MTSVDGSSTPPAGSPPDSPFPHVFRPVTLGTMELRNRIMLPPHGSAIGNLLGSRADAARNIAYWRARAADGAAWVDAVRGRVRNRIVPGFEPHGYGAETAGNYRSPLFVERVAEFVAAMHAEGALVTSQLTVIGGVPHAPGQELSSPLSNSRPHVMTHDDISWYVEEYAYSARQAQLAQLDGIELHLNHDDLLEWFLSPHTNHRDDQYGSSSHQSRARFAVEVLAAIRAESGSPGRFPGRGPLRTVRARHPGTRLKQAPGALRARVLASCVGGPEARDRRRRVSSGFGSRPGCHARPGGRGIQRRSPCGPGSATSVPAPGGTGAGRR